jgi:hypothetical protein
MIRSFLNAQEDIAFLKATIKKRKGKSKIDTKTKQNMVVTKNNSKVYTLGEMVNIRKDAIGYQIN